MEFKDFTQRYVLGFTCGLNMGMEEVGLRKKKKSISASWYDHKKVIVCKCYFSYFLPFIFIFSAFFFTINQGIIFLWIIFIKHAKHILFYLKIAGSVLFNCWYSPPLPTVLRELQVSSWRDCALFPGNETSDKDLMKESGMVPRDVEGDGLVTVACYRRSLLLFV